MSRRPFCLVLFLMLVVLGVDPVTVQAQKRPLQIRMGTLAPRDSSWHRIIRQMGQQWSRDTDQEVVLKIYPGGIVGDETEMISKMRLGQLQAAAISAAGLADIDPAAYGLMLPLMFESYREWDFVRGQLNQELEERLKTRGFVVLAWSDVGWVYFFSREPVQNPAQLKKMKLAASVTEAAAVEIMKWAGFNPVPITIVDLVTGLQTGLVDVVYLPIIFTEGTNLYRYARNMTDLKWAPLQAAVVMHTKAWNRLSTSHQKILMRHAGNAGQRLREDTRKREIASLNAMKARDLKVWRVESEDLLAWQRTVASAYPRIREKLIPPDFFDRVKKLRDDYRANHPNNGSVKMSGQ